MKQFLKEHPYYYLLLYVPVFLLWFYLVEQLHIPENGYWVSYLPLDDKIPFFPPFVVFYVLWYPLLLSVGIYLLLKEPDAFRRYLWFFIVGISACLLICTIFPNGQNLRPVSMKPSFFTWLIGLLYGADTNTNVLPSMHVVGTAAVVYGCLYSKTLRRPRWLIPICLLSAGICLSTVLIKQHSVLDLFTGLAVCLPVWLVVEWICRRLYQRS